MPDSKFFGIPFGASGDKATIPEATQPSGAISWQQGFGPDYERDPATDPLAKRVPRDETNEFYFQTSNALRFLQLYGTPEWYDEDDSGNPVSYPLTARVRHTVGGVMRTWVSIAAANTAEPGTDPTKWVEDTAFSISALEATLAEALAGTAADKLITPRRLASSVQAGAWNFAPTAGTAGAATLTLSPAPASYRNGMIFAATITTGLTAGATLNVNGLGALPVVRVNGSAIAAGDVAAGDTALFLHAGGSAYLIGLPRSLAVAKKGIQVFSASGNFIVPADVTRVKARVWGAGGGGGAANGSQPGGGGGGGGYAEGWVNVTPGQVITVTVGAAGVGGVVVGGPGGTSGSDGGASSFGSAVAATGGTRGTGTFVDGPSNPGTGGPNGTGTSGDFGSSGGGAAGAVGGTNLPGGSGAGASLGGAGGGSSQGPGYPGSVPGGGGAGRGSGAGGGAGSPGAAGRVVVEW